MHYYIVKSDKRLTRLTVSSTFAWYAATSTGALSATGSAATLIAAEADEIEFDGGNLTFSSAFATVTGSLPTYHPATAEPAKAAYFDDVSLTNDNGYTYGVSPAGDVVELTTSITDPHGTAKVIFSLRNGSSAKPSADEVKNACNGENKSVSLYIRKQGYAKVIGTSAPTKASADNHTSATHQDEYKDLVIQVKLTLNASSGAYSVQYTVDGGANWTNATENETASTPNGTWDLQFYYAMAPRFDDAVSTTATGTDVIGDHNTSDKIVVSTAASD